jgi:lysophospholipase L1-like esterase
LNAETPEKPPGRKAPRISAPVALGLSVLLSLVLVEITLRLVGFTYELKVQVVEAQAPNRDRVFEGYSVDRDLLWVRKTYPEILERALTHHPRLVHMGDSCTEFGDYDRRLDQLLRAERGSAPGFANFGCAGWSTYQGRRQMQRDVRRVAPDIVTIFYGWNDHWKSVGLDDREVARFNETLLYRLRGLRLAQLATKVTVALKARRPGGPPPRVSEPDFEKNLVEMVRIALELGAVPVLLTAPTPAFENEGRWTGDLLPFPEIHRRYAAIVRRVASANGAVLCDLAARFDTIPRGTLRSVYFFKDEVHLTDEGNQLIAETLAACFRERGLLAR